MFHERTGQAGLNYYPCDYGFSRVPFRGPRANLDRPFIAFLGGDETFGPFVEAPFPTLVAERFGVQAVNLGIRHAGPDALLQSQAVLDLCQRALATVVQLPLVANLTNRYYRVHPRRNDRFLEVTDLFRETAPAFDTCDIHFTGHLWTELRRQVPALVPDVQAAVSQTWVERMQQMLCNLGLPVYILWVAPVGPQEHSRTMGQPGITGPMLRALAPFAKAQITVRPSTAALAEGASSMIFARKDRAKAAHALNTAMHRDVAAEVAAHLSWPRKRPAHRSAGQF